MWSKIKIEEPGSRRSGGSPGEVRLGGIDLHPVTLTIAEAVAPDLTPPVVLAGCGCFVTDLMQKLSGLFLSYYRAERQWSGRKSRVLIVPGRGSTGSGMFVSPQRQCEPPIHCSERSWSAASFSKADLIRRAALRPLGTDCNGRRILCTCFPQCFLFLPVGNGKHFLIMHNCSQLGATHGMLGVCAIMECRLHRFPPDWKECWELCKESSEQKYNVVKGIFIHEM